MARKEGVGCVFVRSSSSTYTYCFVNSKMMIGRRKRRRTFAISAILMTGLSGVSLGPKQNRNQLLPWIPARIPWAFLDLKHELIAAVRKRRKKLTARKVYVLVIINSAHPSFLSETEVSQLQIVIGRKMSVCARQAWNHTLVVVVVVAAVVLSQGNQAREKASQPASRPLFVSQLKRSRALFCHAWLCRLANERDW